MYLGIDYIHVDLGHCDTNIDTMLGIQVSSHLLCLFVLPLPRHRGLPRSA
jgi:hypothetical protein